MPLRKLNAGMNEPDATEQENLIENEVESDNTAPYPVNYDNDDDDHAGGFVNSGNDEFLPATLPVNEPLAPLHFRTVDLHQQSQVLNSEAPKDPYYFTYFVFYLLGIATMTPWNFFVTAEDYWMYKFRNVSLNGTGEIDQDLTPLQRSFTCDLTLTASLAGTVFLILNAIYGHIISLKIKMLTTLGTILVVFIITTAFVEVNTDHWQELFFLITLLTVVIMNISSATMSGGVFGIAGVFPSEYMTALVSGQALGGILTALCFIIVLAFGAAPNITAFIYFIIGTVLIALCIICYISMSGTSFFKYYAEGGPKYKILCEMPGQSRTIDTGTALEPNIREVFGKIYVDAVTIFVLFTTTLSVYPGVTVLMQSQSFGNGNAWNDIYYLPVVNYLFFNTGDYLGRIIAGIWERPRNNPHTVLLMALTRISYIPFILCSNTDLHNFLPTLVHKDMIFIAMIITFAITNGYLTNIILIMAPRSVMQHEKEIASSIMAAALSCGLAMGSIFSMMFVRML